MQPPMMATSSPETAIAAGERRAGAWGTRACSRPLGPYAPPYACAASGCAHLRCRRHCVPMTRPVALPSLLLGLGVGQPSRQGTLASCRRARRGDARPAVNTASVLAGLGAALWLECGAARNDRPARALRPSPRLGKRCGKRSGLGDQGAPCHRGQAARHPCRRIPRAPMSAQSVESRSNLHEGQEEEPAYRTTFAGMLVLGQEL